MDLAAEAHLPDDWREAIEAAQGRRRILVLGATDMGKTSFIRALADAIDEPLRLVDLDPGQKMLGPPGTASLGTLGELHRFIFLGSTSASNLRGIGLAAATLSAEAAEAGRFVVNTAGFVVGLGARLQVITAKAVAPDLIVEIGKDPAAAPIVAAPESVALLRLARSPAARRKSPAVRARLRQEAFGAALAGAVALRLEKMNFHPAPPAVFEREVRPVCALADEDGRDMCLGVLLGVEEGAATIEAPPPLRPPHLVRIGKMWAEPKGGEWRLLDKLSPAWSA